MRKGEFIEPVTVWDLPQWQSGYSVFEGHRQELLDRQVRLLVFLLASEYDFEFLEPFRRLERDLKALTGPFVRIVAFTAPLPARQKTFSEAAPYIQTTDPDPSGLASAMTRSTYELAAKFGVPFDELPSLVFIDPQDPTTHVRVSLKQTTLDELFSLFRSVLSDWRMEHQSLLDEAEELWILKDCVQGRTTMHPLITRLLERHVIPVIEEALRVALLSDGVGVFNMPVDRDYVLGVFERFRRDPYNPGRLVPLLENENLTLNILGDKIGSKSFRNKYEHLLRAAAQAELDQRKPVDVPGFPIENLRKLASGTALSIRVNGNANALSVVSTVEKSFSSNQPLSFEGVQVFLSYSRADESIKEDLERHAAVLRRSGLVRFWHDRLIDGGSNWREEIEEHLNTANIIILIVSADFFNSDFIYSVELKRALERNTSNRARVLPIIAKPSEWKESSLANLQVLPKDGMPISLWPNRDQAFFEIVTAIRKVAESLIGKSQKVV